MHLITVLNAFWKKPKVNYISIFLKITFCVIHAIIILDNFFDEIPIIK